jgi:nitroreductase
MSTKSTTINHFRKPTFEIDSIYLNRWSPRSFQEKDVPEEVLFSIFEAARWAPSAANIQPWRFIIARDDKDLETFFSFINEGNLSWCKKAPVLALIISNSAYKNGTLRSHAFDTGAAWGFLSLQAAKNGLMTHAMGGFDVNKARKVLNIPSEYDLHAVVAIGYQGEKKALNEELQQREVPSNRNPLNELIFEGDFGKSVK